MTPGQENFCLTPREMEIVSAVAAGYTNKEISENLKLTQRTVSYHLYIIMEKWGISTGTQLALLWLRGHGSEGTR